MLKRNVIVFILLFFISLEISFASPLFLPEEIPNAVTIFDISDLSTESNYTNGVAHCSTQTCYTNQGETTPAVNSYCDTTSGITINAHTGTWVSKGLFPDGCVRYLFDRSNYNSIGWQIAQDDQGGKLRYIPNCLNHLPCMEGYLKDDEILDQSGTIEMPPADYVTTSILDADFSVFVLYKHKTNSANLSCIFGHSLYCLGVTTDNKLYLRINTFNTTYGAVNYIDENWHLYEMHRTSSGDITILIDGTDTGFTTNNISGFAIGYFMSTFKGTSASIGQMMSFYLYDRKLSSQENLNLRKYIYMKYLIGGPYVQNMIINFAYVEENSFVPGEVISSDYLNFSNCQNDCIQELPYGLTLNLQFMPEDYELVTVTDPCNSTILMDQDRTCTYFLNLKNENINSVTLQKILLKGN